MIRRIVTEAINQGNLAVAEEAFAPDYLTHVPGVTNLPSGPGAFKNIISIYRVAFPDYHMEIQDLVAEGDKLVNRFITTGTHKGPLWGLPPTGKAFEIQGMVMHRFEDGKIKESWLADDIPSMLKQLGLEAPPRQGPPRGPSSRP
jgi:steroid delta-isomerase-like uncharacterized protein